MENYTVNAAVESVELQEEFNESFSGDDEDFMARAAADAENSVKAKSASSKKDNAQKKSEPTEVQDDQTSDDGDDGSGGNGAKKAKAKQVRARAVSASEKAKFAKLLVESFSTDDSWNGVVRASKACGLFNVSKQVAKDIYLAAGESLFEKAKKYVKWVDDEVAAKNDLPYVNAKGTLTIPTEAMKNLSNYEDLKKNMVKFNMTHDEDGTIVLEPIM
ncbi:hypothetical protein [Maridesulfovibrio bastinii]|uniref:hypothetical protein n=1 Tax=Maridesulfovibrio bastinii TaxID=47157 RepID=UPI0003FAF019|nr:hypothetical protein [Maridesulfovibrio bastinii]